MATVYPDPRRTHTLDVAMVLRDLSYRDLKLLADQIAERFNGYHGDRLKGCDLAAVLADWAENPPGRRASKTDD